ncbi:MAG: hypothetical protein ACXAB8_10085 [Promethearchaeota archaeon]|jgi:hypothetical protein
MEKRYIPLLIMLGFIILLIITVVVAAVFGIPIIALDQSEISIASFDYWSLGHFLWGVGLFVIAFTLGWIIKNLTGSPKDPINEPDFKSFIVYWIIILIIAGLWEVVENTILHMVNIKARFDSAANIITDIITWGIGGCVSV